MLNLFSNNKSIIDAKVLQELLDEILTPKLKQIGLTKSTNYSWHEQTLKEIRHGFTYNLLKGSSGTFTWGVNLDFLPILHGDKIEYHRTAKKYTHHLFEWTNEYSNSFFSGQMKNGVTTHFGFKEAKKSITILFERYEQSIIQWFDTAKTIENLVDITERQIKTGNHYNIHSPSPKYILPFLYAKKHQVDKAIELFDKLELFHFDNNESAKEKVKAKLFLLTEKNCM